MKDPSGTDQELIKEISFLKQRIKELERSELEHKQAEEALKETEQYASIFENALEGITLTTPEGQYISVNPALARMLGYDTPEELIKTVTDIAKQLYVNPDDRVRLRKTLAEQGGIQRFETRNYRKDGSIIWVSVNSHGVRDPAGRVFYYEGFITDITERKRAEEALKEAEDKYHSIFENAVEGIFQTTPEGRYLSANPAHARMLGYDSPEELIKAVTDLSKQGYVNPEDRARLKKILAEQGSIHGFETRHYRKDRSIIWVSVSSRAVRDPTGKVLYYEGSITDITARKQAEEALRESEEQYRSLVENIDFGVNLIDKDFKIVMTNAVTSKQFNKPVCEFVGKTCFEEFEKHQTICPHCPGVKAMATGRPHQAEIENVRDDGSPLSVRVHAFPLFYPDGAIKGFTEVVEDITDRKQTEENLKKSESLLKEAQHMAHIGHWELDPATGTGTWSEEMFHIRGLDPARGVPSFEDYLKMIHPDDRDTLHNAMAKATTDGTPYDIEVRFLRPDKSIRWMSAHGHTSRDSDGTVIRLFGTTQDITERKELEQKLLSVSISDELTGLYNRRGFLTLAEQQMRVTQRTKKDMLLFFADLDKMKQINDTLGHQEGDNALIEVAAILKKVFRESDIIGRMGGDEFATLAIDTTDETGEVLMKRMRNYLDDYNRPGGRSYALALSIGIAHYDPEKPSSLDELMAQADTLMYEEKRNKQH